MPLSILNEGPLMRCLSCGVTLALAVDGMEIVCREYDPNAMFLGPLHTKERCVMLTPHSASVMSDPEEVDHSAAELELGLAERIQGWTAPICIATDLTREERYVIESRLRAVATQSLAIPIEGRWDPMAKVDHAKRAAQEAQQCGCVSGVSMDLGGKATAYYDDQEVTVTSDRYATSISLAVFAAIVLGAPACLPITSTTRGISLTREEPPMDDEGNSLDLNSLERAAITEHLRSALATPFQDVTRSLPEAVEAANLLLRLKRATEWTLNGYPTGYRAEIRYDAPPLAPNAGVVVTMSGKDAEALARAVELVLHQQTTYEQWIKAMPEHVKRKQEPE